MGLRAHWFQHVSFEGLGSIQDWLSARKAAVGVTRFHESPVLPSLDDVDLLIIMGGPMSVNDETEHPWLASEKEFTAQAIRRGTPVLGICLGAQLIASALGARVRRGAFTEIGWHTVERAGAAEGLAALLPRRMEAFHWHGETFDVPQGGHLLARSAGCENQAFQVGDRVLGLQFHLETTPASARALVESCRADLVPGKYVQTEREIMGSPAQFQLINSVMDGLLDALADPRLVD